MAVASAGPLQVCTLLQTDNHTSTLPLCFLQAGCTSCRPTNSVKALKAQHWRHIHSRTAHNRNSSNALKCWSAHITATALHSQHCVQLANNSNSSHYYTKTPILTASSRTTCISQYQKLKLLWILIRQEMMGFGMAVASDWRFANNLHLGPDR